MNLSELEIEYVKNNKKLFIIHNIDRMRDGGTTCLECFLQDRQKFYIHKDNKTFHNNYPTTDENKVVDKPTIARIINQIESYKQKKIDEISRIDNLFENIKKSNLIIN